MRAPSSVCSVTRRSISSTPSERRTCQSALPPATTVPRRRGPSKLPPLKGAVRRVPRGTAPRFCGVATFTRSIISSRVFINIASWTLEYRNVKDTPPRKVVAERIREPSPADEVAGQGDSRVGPTRCEIRDVPRDVVSYYPYFSFIQAAYQILSGREHQQ